jgi:hypothetical protein
MGPSAGLTLLAGGAAMWVGHLGFPLWAMWGVGIWLVIVALGAGVIPRVGRRLASRLDEGAPDGEVRDLQRRIGRYQWSRCCSWEWWSSSWCSSRCRDAGPCGVIGGRPPGGVACPHLLHVTRELAYQVGARVQTAIMSSIVALPEAGYVASTSR